MNRLLAMFPAVAAALLSTVPAMAQWQLDGVPVCAAVGDQTSPVLVRNGGGAFVIWEDGRSTPSRIFAQRLSGLGTPLWQGGGIEVATRTGNQGQPVAVGDAVGGVIIAWVQQINADRRHNGHGWSWNDRQPARRHPCLAG